MSSLRRCEHPSIVSTTLVGLCSEDLGVKAGRCYRLAVTRTIAPAGDHSLLSCNPDHSNVSPGEGLKDGFFSLASLDSLESSLT